VIVWDLVEHVLLCCRRNVTSKASDEDHLVIVRKLDCEASHQRDLGPRASRLGDGILSVGGHACRCLRPSVGQGYWRIVPRSQVCGNYYDQVLCHIPFELFSITPIGRKMWEGCIRVISLSVLLPKHRSASRASMSGQRPILAFEQRDVQSIDHAHAGRIVEEIPPMTMNWKDCPLRIIGKSYGDVFQNIVVGQKLSSSKWDEVLSKQHVPHAR